MLFGISISTEVFAAPITLSTSSSAGSCSISIGGVTYYFNPTGTNFEGMTLIKNDTQTASASDADFVIGGTYYKLVNPTVSTNSIENRYFSGVTSTTAGSVKNATSGNSSITNSNFVGNKAENTSGGTVNGGVLAFSRVTPVTISNVLFKDNSATGNGGAIIFDGDNSVTISDTRFLNNTANSGGAIYLRNVRNAIISNTKFIGNNATANGGAIYSLNASGGTNYIIVSGSQFGDSTHNTDDIYLYQDSSLTFTGDESLVYSQIFIKDSSSVSVGSTATAGTVSLYGVIDSNTDNILTVNSGSRLNLKSGSRLGDTLGLALKGTLGLENDFTWKQNYTSTNSAIVDIASGAKLIFDNNSGADITLNNITGSGTVQSTGNNLTINNISDTTNMNLSSGTASVSANDVASAKLGRYTLDNETLTLTTTNGGVIGAQNANLINAGSSNNNILILNNDSNATAYQLADVKALGKLTLKNSDVKLLNTRYVNNTYAFDNVNLDLIDNTIQSYTFDNAEFANTTLKVDLNLNPVGVDNLVINSGSGNLTLTNLNIMGAITSDFEQNYEIVSGTAVSGGSVTFDVDAGLLGTSDFGLGTSRTVTNSSAIGTQTVSKYTNVAGKTVGVTVRLVLRDVLASINQVDGADRFFNFDNNGDIYTLRENTGVTADGTLSINVNDSKSNVAFDAGHAYSMFVVNSELARVIAQNLTFKGAKKGTNGSVFDISNGIVYLNNVRFQENEGYALYNEGGTVTLVAPTFEYNTIYENALYNKGTMTINGLVNIATNIKNEGGTLTISAGNNSIL